MDILYKEVLHRDIVEIGFNELGESVLMKFGKVLTVPEHVIEYLNMRLDLTMGKDNLLPTDLFKINQLIGEEIGMYTVSVALDFIVMASNCAGAAMELLAFSMSSGCGDKYALLKKLQGHAGLGRYRQAGAVTGHHIYEYNVN